MKETNGVSYKNILVMAHEIPETYNCTLFWYCFS